MAAAQAGAGAPAARPAGPPQTFAGIHNNLRGIDEERRPCIRLTFDQLSAAGFQNEVDFDKLNVDLCRTAKPTERAWPVVAPSPEIFGAVTGWRLTPEREASGETDNMIRDRNVYEPYRYMFSPLHERAAALEARMDEMADAIKQVYGLKSAGMSIGRICPESEAHRINKASVMLELQHGSAGASSNSGRLTLDFQEAANYSVFSGQIVGVKGASLREGVLNVTEIAHRAPPPPVHVPKENALALAGLRQGSGPLRVTVAAGPFTDAKDLHFDPLSKLLDKALVQKSDVIVLTGPFVDSDHEQVKSGAPSVTLDGDSTELTYDQVWADVFCGILDASLLDDAMANVQVVLQPSVQDVTGAEPVFPQWPFPAAKLAALSPGVRSRVVLCPNPASFVVGDLLWGMTSTDPVAGMNTDDATDLTSPADKALDRYTLLARHVLDQRSFYPLFPAAIPAMPAGKTGLMADMDQASRSVPLEVTRMWNLGLPACPDVLVLPSRLGFPQVRPLGEHTVLINPGQLASKKTFARVLVYPDLTVGSSDLDAQDYITNRAQTRVRVDIDKL